MGKKKRYIDIDRVLELRAQGYTFKQVSKIMGIAVVTIRARIKELNIEPSTWNRNCKGCGKSFVATNIRNLYCTEDCKNKKITVGESIKLHYKECKTCFNLFVTRYEQKEYCERNCMKYHSKRKTVLSKRRLKRCKNCNVWFWNNNSSINCCSEYCTKRYQKEHSKTLNKKRLKQIKENGKVDKDITITKLMKIHDSKCYLCQTVVSLNKADGIGKSYANIEHIVPISRGGTHTWDNVSLSCSECNCKKGTMTLEEYLKKIS